MLFDGDTKKDSLLLHLSTDTVAVLHDDEVVITDSLSAEK